MKRRLLKSAAVIWLRKEEGNNMAKKFSGLAGKILRVDLTRGKVKTERSDPALFKQFIGARGVGAAMIYQELKAGIDPLGPDNKLIFMTGPVEGTMAPGASKITVTFKSPATNSISWALCGGQMSAELKFAGYDGIIVEGKSAKPVYLWINDDKVEIRDASAYWGKKTHETEDGIRAELKQPTAVVAVIGPSGEKKVLFACIQADYHREFGRGGCGAVMGSKNLKAIAVHGTGGVQVADAKGLAGLTEEIYGTLAGHGKAQARRQFGTVEMVDGINNLGFWSVRNFQGGVFEAGHEVNHAAMKSELVFGDVSCYGCPVACGKNSKVKTGSLAGTVIEGPEFESVGLLGPNCGVRALDYIAKASEICDTFGMDTISAGVVVSFAMEAYERGILTNADTYGLELKFGNGDALLSLLEKIALREEGLGDLLANGSKIAAEKYGVPELAMQVKGLELSTYDPRGCKGMGITYATSAKGAHHMISPTMGPEIAGDRHTSEGKGKLVAETQKFMAIVDSMSLCASMRFALDLAKQMKVYELVTGVPMSNEKGLESGARILSVERLFNLREGFGRKDDTLPRRFLAEKMPSGPSEGQVVDLEPMLDDFYQAMGWDQEGVPTYDTVKQLGLESFQNIKKKKGGVAK
jgi:aldehyde:ferredoxin oxidoreductase